MKIREESVTPTLAASYLAMNKLNRDRSSGHVRRLADAMLSGAWKENGDTIVFNCGRLIDGQHRLAAIIESGVTVKMLIVEGVDADAFTTTWRRKPTLTGRGCSWTKLSTALERPSGSLPRRCIGT